MASHSPARSVPLSAVLLVMALSRVASAQAAGSEVVITGTRTPENSQRATVRTDVISAEEATRRGATNLGEALASQPGVIVNAGAYDHLGGVSAIQIQGLDRERVLVLEDGERVIGDTGGAIDLSLIPVSDLERVEIVAGPMSSLYGSSAIGGVVNTMTGPPPFPGTHGRFRLEGRSHRGLLASGSTAYKSERYWIGADGSFFRADGVAEEPNEPDLVIPSVRRWLAGIRGGVTWNEAVETRLRLRWLHQEATDITSQTRPGAGTYVIELPTTNDRYIAHWITTYRLGRGHSLRLTLGQQWFVGTSEKLYRNSPVREERARHGNMQSIEAVATLADGPRTWVLGARAEVERYRQSLEKATATPSGIDDRAFDEVPTALLGMIAGYGQLSWKLGRLTLLPGIRGEVYRNYGSSLAPRLAASLRPSDTVQLRASVGRGFRTPTAKELGFVFDHSFYGYRIEGNPGLVPEQSWGVSADATWRPGSSVTLRAGAYANWIEDLIDLDLAAGEVENGVVNYSYRNFARARTSGGQLSAIYRAAERIRVELSYDYLHTRDEILGEPLPGRSPHVVTSAVYGDLPLRLEANARVRYHSPAFVSKESGDAPEWVSLDARIARGLWPSAEAYIGVSNALDSRKSAGAIADMRPLLGRVFYLGLQAELPMEDDL